MYYNKIQLHFTTTANDPQEQVQKNVCIKVLITRFNLPENFKHCDHALFPKLNPKFLKGQVSALVEKHYTQCNKTGPCGQLLTMPVSW